MADDGHVERDHRDPRGEFVFDCGVRDCHEYFHGDDLAKIARQGARHWNREHGDELKHRHEAIDERVIGGHHIQGNSYEVRKYKIYLTSFDIMERIGLEDGRLVPSDKDQICPECLREVPDEEHRIEDDPDDRFNDDWTCSICVEEEIIERREEENQQLTEWCT